MSLQKRDLLIEDWDNHGRGFRSHIYGSRRPFPGFTTRLFVVISFLVRDTED